MTRRKQFDPHAHKKIDDADDDFLVVLQLPEKSESVQVRTLCDEAKKRFEFCKEFP